MIRVGASSKLLAAPAVLALTLPAVLEAREERTGNGAKLRYWVVDDSTKVLPGSQLGEAGGSVELAGAGGETVAFQLVLESSVARSRVRLGVSNLVGEEEAIASSRFEVFLETYIDCPNVAPEIVTLGPGRYPDPLVPLWSNGPGTTEVAHPLELPASQRRVLWIDVAIPRGRPAGRYRGKIELDLDSEESAAIDIALERYGFDLPARPSLSAWVPLYPDRYVEREKVLTLQPKEVFDLAWRYFRMAHDHRFVSQSIEIEPRLTWDESTGALLAVDWSAYDLVHGPILDGSLFDDREAPSIWKVGGSFWWGARPGERPYFGVTSRDESLNAAYRRALTEYAREIRRHFDERGWTRSELFMFLVDRPNLEALPQIPGFIAGYGDALRDSRANIRHLVTLEPGASSKTAGAVDIWAVGAASYRPAEMQARQALGERAWFFQEHEPFVGGHALNHDGLGLRSWAWVAWRYHVDGIYLWSGNYWNRDPYREAVNWDGELLGNGVLFYPGAMLPTIGFPAIQGPVSSVRMKNLRRGLLDYEYFELLRSLGGDPDTTVKRIVRSALNEGGYGPPSTHPLWGKPGDWSHDAKEWDEALREMAREIQVRMKSSGK